MRSFDYDGSRLVAQLGPTNTGKTFRAIERMLEFPTGMIGLPLRLLAREVYDRISALKGEDAVALITGEERRIGANPRYYVCTVEAMPVQIPVAFVVVDEIQLAGDRGRGHVFTDRLLNLRGVRETWFLGSDSIEPLLRAVVPTIEIRRNTRYSRLSHRGPQKLGGLPPRTAIVAFSVERVYALAETIRRKHGGAAVVLGALSPRTRNAQVAMYQAGEVQYMVATDAIGMGLNMDIEHVAFDGLSKFDGRGLRGLSAQEVGQIAGRAGRWKRDGTFGATAELGEIAKGIVEAVEAHRYPALKKLYYRNTDLDFSSGPALLASLRRPPPFAFLAEAREEEDEAVLRTFLSDPEMLKLLQHPDDLRLLWEVCRIPDFRKTMTDSHLQLLKQLFGMLVRGPLPEDHLRSQIGRLNRPEGDVDALTTRLAWIRTWTYVTQRTDWIKDAGHWQGEARKVEDSLSDALHSALTDRFVDPTSRLLGRGAPVSERESGRVVLGGQSVGRLEGLSFRPEAGVEDRRLERAIHAAIEGELRARISRVIEAPHRDFVRSGYQIFWEGGALARLTPGPSVVEPGLRLLRNDLLSPADQARIQRRLSAWLRDEIARFLAPLREDRPAMSAPVRALLYRLQPALGSVQRGEVAELIREFQSSDWGILKLAGVRVGEVYVWAPVMLEAAAVDLRSALAGLALGMAEAPPVPGEQSTGLPDRYHAWVGLQRLQKQLFRIDVVERCGERLRGQARRGPMPLVALGELAGTTERARIVAGFFGWAMEGEELLPPRPELRKSQSKRR